MKKNKREWKRCIIENGHSDPCAVTCLEVLFTADKRWKESSWTPVDGCNVAHACSGILYSHKKDMEYWYILTWPMNLENLVLSERSKSQRIVWLHSYTVSITCRSVEVVPLQCIGGCRDLGWRDGELLLNGRGVSFRVMKMFWNQLVMAITNTLSVLMPLNYLPWSGSSYYANFTSV